MTKRMTKGKVKWFSPELGYGFIENEKYGVIFVHYTAIAGDGYRMLHPDEEVEFELKDSGRGYKAANVRRLRRNTLGGD